MDGWRWRWGTVVVQVTQYIDDSPENGDSERRKVY